MSTDENNQNAGVRTACTGMGSSETLHATNHFTWACTVLAMGIGLIRRPPTSSKILATRTARASNAGALRRRMAVRSTLISWSPIADYINAGPVAPRIVAFRLASRRESQDV